MKKVFALSGYLMLTLFFLIVWSGIFFLIIEWYVLWGILLGVAFFMLFWFRIIGPNTSVLFLLFGEYRGMKDTPAFIWINPFYMTYSISTKVHSTETATLKVNDKRGNPIVISAILVWKVADAYKAKFAVEKYEDFVHIQSESAVRKVTSEHSYESHGEENEITLSQWGERLNTLMTHEMAERLSLAGIAVIEARISHLAYAPEIAQAMLRRQQAEATIAARSKIVEGAVSMVDMALIQLSAQKIVELEPHDKAKMAMQLLTVLCAENVQPTLQANPQ